MTDHIKKADREATLAKYNYCCAACGFGSLDFLECDHVQPEAYFRRAKGRAIDNSPRNLQILCGPCNKAKGDAEFMAALPPRQPEDSVKACDKNRAKWREMVESHKAGQRLF